jgi:hypothetical protein
VLAFSPQALRLACKCSPRRPHLCPTALSPGAPPCMQVLTTAPSPLPHRCSLSRCSAI